MSRISVRVQPRSSRARAAVEGDGLKVWVTAAPVDGAANEAVLEVLAEALGVRKGTLAIVHGHSSRSKVVDLGPLETAEALARVADRA